MKSVCNRVLALFISISLCASAFVGALAFRLDRADATMGEYTQDFAFIQQMFQSSDWISQEGFEQSCEAVLNGSWPPQFSNTAYCPFILMLYDGDGNVFCGIYGTEISEAIGYYNPSNSTAYYVARGNSGSTNGIYCYGWSKIYNGYSSGQLNIKSGAYGTSTWSMSSNSFAIFNENNTTLSQYTCYLSCNIYTGTHATIIDTPLNLVYSRDPISAYNNIVIEENSRYYFTISDNSVLRDVFNAEGVNYFRITLQYSDLLDYFVELPISDLEYLPFSTYPDITNISPLGVQGWEITKWVNLVDAFALTESRAYPVEDWPDYFSYARCVFNKSPNQAAWDEYYSQLNQFLALQSQNEIPTLISTDPLVDIPRTGSNVEIVRPSGSDTQGTTFADYDFGGNSLDLYIHDQALYDLIGNYNLKILIIPYSALSTTFDEERYHRFYIDSLSRWNNNNVVSTVGTIQNPYYGYDFIYQNFDVLIFYPTQYFDHVANTSNHHSFIANRYFFGNTDQSTVNGVYYLTQRAYTHIAAHSITDGISTLTEDLTDWASDQGGYLETITTGIGTIIWDVQTVGGKLSDIYGWLIQFDTKFEKLLDKLDKIIDNTNVDGETNNFWIAPLYWFIKLFEPSTDDYVTSIGEITDTWEALPEIPSVTPIAIPTSQILIPGG